MHEPRTDKSVTGKIGVGMFVMAWVLILGLMTWYFGLRDSARINPNQQIRLSGDNKSVIIEKNVYDQYVFTGHINGTSVTFLVDTGASSVVLNSDTARRIGDLPSGQDVHVVTASGYATAQQTQLESVRIGPIELRNVEALINPTMPGEHVLLGMTALQHIQFSQQGDQLHISYNQ